MRCAIKHVTIDVPEEVLIALNTNPEVARVELRMAAAMKLYEMRRLSSGAAARLAGVPRVAFLQRLGEFGISAFSLDADDLDRETRLA